MGKMEKIQEKGQRSAGDSEAHTGAERKGETAVLELTDYKKQCRDKLLSYAYTFRDACSLKKWGTAKYAYDTALRVLEFLPMEAEEREQLAVLLFGNKGYEECLENPVDGLFREEMVDRAFRECVVKRDMSFADELFRRYGEKPVYSPCPRYPKR